MIARLLSALLIISACSAASPSDSPSSIPQQWVAQIDGPREQCLPIDAEFRNVGERFDENEGNIFDGLLGEYVFSRHR